MKNNKLKKSNFVSNNSYNDFLFLTVYSTSSSTSKSYRKFIYGFYQGCGCFYYARIRTNGTKFYDNGIEQDGLTILKNHGVNWIRVRIWNNPYVVGPEGVGGGNTDEAKAIEMAKRAKALGMKFL